MTINLQTGGFLPQVLPGARSADVQPGYKYPSTDNSSALPQVGPTVQTTATGTPAGARPISSEERYQQVSQAVQVVAANFYPVSDKSFTIFKDSNGQYITRYTSLRDGKVTYIPEPKMLQLFESQQSQDARLQLKV